MTTSPFPSNCRYDDGIAKPLLFLQQLHGGLWGKSCFCNNFMGDWEEKKKVVWIIERLLEIVEVLLE